MTRPLLIAVTSDIHTGSTIAMCPPEGLLLDDGGKYLPSKPQLWLWRCWEHYWEQIRELKREHQADLWLVYNGDLFDGGAHHGTTQTVSDHPEAQAYLADRIFGVPKTLQPSHTFVVRGTEAHVGPSGATEEAFARSIRAERNPETEKWSWWHLRLNPFGALLDFQHHPSTKGNLPWTGPQAAQRLAFRIWSEHALRGLDAPRLALRSHTHVHRDSGEVYPTRAIITPSWQLKTAFAHKVAADSLSDVGGIAVIIQPNGVLDVQTMLYPVAPPTPWRPNAETEPEADHEHAHGPKRGRTPRRAGRGRPKNRG